jgi:hypothetical protein
MPSSKTSVASSGGAGESNISDAVDAQRSSQKLLEYCIGRPGLLSPTFKCLETFSEVVGSGMGVFGSSAFTAMRARIEVSSVMLHQITIRCITPY